MTAAKWKRDVLAYRKWLCDRVAETPLKGNKEYPAHLAYLSAWGELERVFPWTKPGLSRRPTQARGKR